MAWQWFSIPLSKVRHYRSLRRDQHGIDHNTTLGPCFTAQRNKARVICQRYMVVGVVLRSKEGLPAASNWMDAGFT